MPRIYTSGEAAQLCRISIHQIHRCFDQGKLKGHFIPGSRHRRFSSTNVINFLTSAGVSLEHTYYNSANMLLLICNRPEIVLALSAALREAPCRIHQVTDAFSLGCVVQEAMGRFCWAVVDLTLPFIDTRHITHTLKERGWQIVFLGERGQAWLKGGRDLFHLPVDPALIAARLATIMNE